MKRSRRSVFPFVYFIFICLLFVGFIASIVYVNSVIKEYEATNIDAVVDDYVSKMAEKANNGKLIDVGAIPTDYSEAFENSDSIKLHYEKLFCSDKLEIDFKVDDKSSEKSKEGIKSYVVKVNDLILAELDVKLISKSKSKLFIFPVEEYKVIDVRPVFEKKSYTISVLTGFNVKVNGVQLNEENGTAVGGSGVDYVVNDLYTPPVFEISDSMGIVYEHELKGTKVGLPEIYNYELVLPEALTVKVNGSIISGVSDDKGRVSYDIRFQETPEVLILDEFGYSVKYDGQNDIPLSVYTITAYATHTVVVDGLAIPASMTTNKSIVGYEFLDGLAEVNQHKITILKDEPEVMAVDAAGNSVKLDMTNNVVDITGLVHSASGEELPADIANAVNVLDIAEKWSLFMSNDLEFSVLANYLIPGSFQYNAANTYNSSVDKTFTSPHTLLDPPFRNEEVRNFVRLSDNCFAVDICS